MPTRPALPGLSNLPALPARWDRYRFVLGWEDGAVFAGFFETIGLDSPSGLGVRKATSIQLQRGVIDAAALRDWLDAGRGQDQGADRHLVVSLLDSSAQPLKRWRLQGAWPTRVEPPLPAAPSPQSSTSLPTPAVTDAPAKPRPVDLSLDVLSLNAQKIMPA